nr:unnamed protein product [Callosobruchus chinensis]
MATLSPSANSSRLKSPYSLLVPLPLVRIPQPDIMIVPLRMFVIVAGNTSEEGFFKHMEELWILCFLHYPNVFAHTLHGAAGLKVT